MKKIIESRNIGFESDGKKEHSKFYKVGITNFIDMTPGNLYGLPDEFFFFRGGLNE